MTLREDLNWLFKLLIVTLLIIFLDRKVLLWQMDIIPRQLLKTIWIWHFPTTQTVCRKKHLNAIYFFFQRSFWATHWILAHRGLIFRWPILFLSGSSKLIWTAWKFRGKVSLIYSKPKMTIGIDCDHHFRDCNLKRQLSLGIKFWNFSEFCLHKEFYFRSEKFV